MATLIKLSELSAGTKAVVRALPPRGPGALRLREMGMLPGAEVRFVRTAPLGDPLEIQIRGYNLMLRRSEAECVQVEVVGTGA